MTQEGVKSSEIWLLSLIVADFKQTQLHIVDLSKKLAVHIMQLAAHALSLPELIH